MWNINWVLSYSIFQIYVYLLYLSLKDTLFTKGSDFFLRQNFSIIRNGTRTSVGIYNRMQLVCILSAILEYVNNNGKNITVNIVAELFTKHRFVVSSL